MRKTFNKGGLSFAPTLNYFESLKRKLLRHLLRSTKNSFRRNIIEKGKNFFANNRIKRLPLDNLLWNIYVIKYLANGSSVCMESTRPVLLLLLRPCNNWNKACLFDSNVHFQLIIQRNYDACMWQIGHANWKQLQSKCNPSRCWCNYAN